MGKWVAKVLAEKRKTVDALQEQSRALTEPRDTAQELNTSIWYTPSSVVPDSKHISTKGDQGFQASQGISAYNRLALPLLQGSRVAKGD